MMHKDVFTIGDLPKAYIGYTSGKLWNGWATPHFEIAEALRVMADYNETTDNPMSYNEETDTFYIADEAIWKGENCETEEGIKHLYGIGAYYWIWDEINDEDCRYLAEQIDEFIYDLDTYGYRDVGIERDEMVEAIKNQLKEPTVFQQVYEIWHNEELDIDDKFDVLCNCIRG